MTEASTTIRVSAAQRERLRSLARGRNASMADTLDDALEALRRIDFYEKMSTAEQELRADPARWAEYVAERDAWLTPELSTS
jgi:predicted transcriptional regulator